MVLTFPKKRRVTIQMLGMNISEASELANHKLPLKKVLLLTELCVNN